MSTLRTHSAQVCRSGRGHVCGRFVAAGVAVIAVALVVACEGNPSGVDPTAPLRQARVSTATSEIAVMANALKAYKVANGDYPSTEQGLAAALESPAVDPWGTAYVYRYPGRDGGRPFDLYSVGPDKLPGTADQPDISWGAGRSNCRVPIECGSVCVSASKS